MTSAPLRFADALSTATASADAEGEVLAGLSRGLGGVEPDLLAVFATHHHGSALEGMAARLRDATGADVVLGCTGESVIGSAREVEGRAGLSAWAASLPDTRLRFFEARLAAGAGGAVIEGFPALDEPERSSLLVLADPFTFPMEPFLARLNQGQPVVPAVGGMASGGMGAGQNLLLTADGARHEGLVGVVLEGGVEVVSVVSQGCRPVGTPWVVTAANGNVIERLGGRPATDVLFETLGELGEEDRRTYQRGPLVGLAIDARKSEFQRGDFLGRGLIGLDQKTRALAIADTVRRGQTIQFLVRDARSAGEDLSHLMEERAGGDAPGPAESGALLFTCNGRGRRMFGEPDHDARRVREGLRGDAAVAGFFAAGEIGPIGGRNFLHGFTASVAVFRRRLDGRA